MTATQLHNPDRAADGTAPAIQSTRRYTLEAALLGLLVGLLVVAPWTTHGYLLLLDWVTGPSQTLTPGVYGLSGSALDAMPFRIMTQALRHILGPAPTAWFLILMFFPLACAGAAVAAGGGRWRRLPAGLFMICNPFVVDRIRAGHVSFLLGIAILPWLFAAAYQARQQGKWFAVRPAVWYALAISINPHLAWLGLATLGAFAVLPRPTWRDIARTAQVVLAASLVYSYALILWLTNTRTLNVTTADLEAYATAPGPGGLLPTVMSLHGFWRTGHIPPATAISASVAVVLFLGLLAAVIAGLVYLFRIRPSRAAPLTFLIVLGILFGAGIHGPAGWLYRLAFDTLPLFEAMREQQKWLALTVMGYALAFGAAVDALSQYLKLRGQGHRGIRLIAAPLALAPAAIAPTLLWGLGGTIQTSTYPQGWYAADGVMGAGQGQVLFLPWHAYQPFPFTGGRTIATPGEAFFRRRVLGSDAVELPGLRTDSTSLRTAYVDKLVAAGGTPAFGRLIAPLGIEFVVVAKNISTKNYSWVGKQRELQLMLDTESMAVYRVVPRGVGRVVFARSTDFNQAVRLAAAGEIGTEALLDSGGGPVVSDGRSELFGGISRAGATKWQLEPGVPGWVVVPEEWSPGWQVGGRSGRPTVAGTVAVQAPAESTEVIFGPWKYLRPAMFLSLMVLLVLIAAGIAEHWQQVTGVWRPIRRRGR